MRRSCTTGRGELTDAGGENADAKHDTNQERGGANDGEDTLGGEVTASAVIAAVDEGRVRGHAFDVSELGILHEGHYLQLLAARLSVAATATSTYSQGLRMFRVCRNRTCLCNESQ